MRIRQAPRSCVHFCRFASLYRIYTAGFTKSSISNTRGHIFNRPMLDDSWHERYRLESSLSEIYGECGAAYGGHAILQKSQGVPFSCRSPPRKIWPHVFTQSSLRNLLREERLRSFWQSVRRMTSSMDKRRCSAYDEDPEETERGQC